MEAPNVAAPVRSARGLSHSQGLFTSLRARLSLLVIVASLPAVSLLGYVTWEQRRAALDHARTSALSVARSVADSQRQLIEATRVLLRALALMPEVRRPGAGCDALLARILRQQPFHTNLGVASADGAVHCSALVSARPVSIADRDYFRRALSTRDFAVGGFQVGRITGQTTINAGLPLLDAGGGLQGVLVAAMNLDWINHQLQTARLPTGSAALVVDGSGTAYARYPPLAVIGRNLKELPTVAAALARQGEGTAEAQGLDGEERLYGYAPIVLRAGGPPDGYVLIGIPRRTAFAEASLIAWRTLGGFAFVVLLGIAAVWYFGELFVLRSAGALAQAARRMAAGETDTVGELAREPGELGEYARTLEQLAAHRRLQHEDLVRTAAELQASERRYRDIIETAPDGILTVDENQTIVSFNASAEAMFGYTAREVVGQPWTSCCPSASAPHTMRMCARLPPSRCAAGAWAADASCRDGARMEPSFRWRSACRSSPRTARPCIPRWCAT